MARPELRCSFVVAARAREKPNGDEEGREKEPSIPYPQEVCEKRCDEEDRQESAHGDQASAGEVIATSYS